MIPILKNGQDRIPDFRKKRRGPVAPSWGIWGRWFLIVPFLCLMVGCETVPTLSEEEHLAFVHLWPKPPDRPRILAEISLRSLSDIKLEKQKSILDAATGLEEKANIFKKPVSVVARYGRIYVADSIAGMVQVFNVPKRQVFSIGYRLEGKLSKPSGMALGSKGNLFVVDSSARRVVEYDPLGLFVRFFGDKKTLQKPNGVAVSPDDQRVYVVDSGGVESDQHQLLIFDQKGGLLERIGRRGGAEGEFNLPTDVAVAADGTVYVLDAGNFRVQAFDPKGKFLHAWGQVGRGLGQFARPKGVAVDAVGRIYVTDSSFSNIQVFNTDGKLLMSFGDRGMEDGLGRFVLPSGIAVDETGRIYVVDQFHRKVDVFRILSKDEGEAILQKASSVR